METPRKFITAKLSIREPGPSSVLIILLALMKIRAHGSKALKVINLRGVSTNKTITCFIAMQTYKEFITYKMFDQTDMSCLNMTLHDIKQTPCANVNPNDPCTNCDYI